MLIYIRKKIILPDTARFPMQFQTEDLIHFHMWNIHSLDCVLCVATYQLMDMQAVKAALFIVRWIKCEF